MSLWLLKKGCSNESKCACNWQHGAHDARQLFLRMNHVVHSCFSPQCTLKSLPGKTALVAGLTMKHHQNTHLCPANIWCCIFHYIQALERNGCTFITSSHGGIKEGQQWIPILSGTTGRQIGAIISPWMGRVKGASLSVSAPLSASPSPSNSPTQTAELVVELTFENV